MGQPLLVAIAGTGWARRVVVPALRALPDVEVVGICSLRRENAVSLAATAGSAVVADDVESLLSACQPDLLYIATPPDLHLAGVEAGIRNRVSILCEKPLALNLEQALCMRRAAEVAEVRVLVDHELRFHPAVRRLRHGLLEREIGDPGSVTFELRWSRRLPRGPHGWWQEKERGGGVLGAIGSHFVDLLHVLFGPIRWVQGSLTAGTGVLPDAAGVPRAVTADDHAVVAVHMECGARGVISLDGRAGSGALSGMTLGFHGDRGTFLLDGDAQTLWRITGEDRVCLVAASEGPTLPQGVPEGLFPRACFLFLRALVPALLADVPLPDAALLDAGIDVQVVLDAIRRSDSEGRREAIS